MKHGKVSIIVPVYNASRYLTECLDSILSQAYQDLEIIIVDDGSLDNSGEICDSYARRDRRLSVIHQKNGGTVAARQKGLEAAKGKYTCFVDADDWIEPGMCEFLLSRMQESQSDLVQTQIVGWKTDPFDDEIIELREDNRAEIVQQRLFCNGTLMPNLFPKLFITEKIRSAFSKVPIKQQYGEDLLCLLHYLNTCSRICLSSRDFYHYRVTDGSASRKGWLQMCIDSTYLYEEIRRTSESYGQWEIYKEGADAYYQSLLAGHLKRGMQDENAVERYRFPEMMNLENKQIVLYGAGKVGTDFYKQIVCNKKQKIVAWIDRDPVGSAVQSPNCLKGLEYDYIVIAIAKEDTANEIRDDLLTSGLCDEEAKIIWKKPERLW